MNEQTRRDALAQAGFNPLRLAPDQIRFDLFSDVPHQVRVPGERTTRFVDPDELAAAFAPLTGDARLAFATKGRAAEVALVDALELDRPTVLSPGLFATTQNALARCRATIEDLPRIDGSANVDLERLGERLQRGGVNIVYLEVAHNAMFGWPLDEDHLARVRALCDEHAARLLLDATRILTNAVGLGRADVLASARRTLALAHAFTISCAKELLVPGCAVIGSRDADLIGRASMQAFKVGTSMSSIDPPSMRAELFDGVRYTLAHPELLQQRLDTVRSLGDHLSRCGLDIAKPVTGHAVFIQLDPSWVPSGDMAKLFAFTGHVYAVSGVRGQFMTTRTGPTLRLALPLLEHIDERALAELATGVAAAFERRGEIRALRVLDGQADCHPYFRRLGLA